MSVNQLVKRSGLGVYCCTPSGCRANFMRVSLTVGLQVALRGQRPQAAVRRPSGGPSGGCMKHALLAHREPWSRLFISGETATLKNCCTRVTLSIITQCKRYSRQSSSLLTKPQSSGTVTVVVLCQQRHLVSPWNQRSGDQLGDHLLCGNLERMYAVLLILRCHRGTYTFRTRNGPIGKSADTYIV